ncbi:hypothetical protein RJ640_024448, partial [Escallonia rubra]
MVGADAECITIFDSAMSKRKSKSRKKFNDEQIKALENIFETGSKLEPRKKLQLARDLGLFLSEKQESAMKVTAARERLRNTTGQLQKVGFPVVSPKEREGVISYT